MLNIAIVDDGINLKHVKVTTSIMVDSSLKRKQWRGTKSISHGTLCAKIIEKNLSNNVNAYLHSIKVVNCNGKGTIAQLCKGIDICIKNNYKLINISLGSVKESDMEKLKSVIDRAISYGHIIIAADSNEQLVSYPSHFENVIAARFTAKAVKGLYCYKSRKSAFGLHHDSHWNLELGGERIGMPPANSFAAPLLTAQVAKILCNEDCNVFKVIQLLKKGCVNT